MSPELLALLPTVNASLNSLSALLLVAGLLAVRRGRVGLHRACMLGALGISALFLASYLVYHHHVGSVRIGGEGALRTLYFCILVPHVILAAFVPFLALRVVFLAARERIEEHRRLARITWPLWMVVSVTGVLVYVLLYHVVGPATPS